MPQLLQLKKYPLKNYILKRLFQKKHKRFKNYYINKIFYYQDIRPNSVVQSFSSKLIVL